MPTLAVSRDVLDLIEYVEGETIKDKLIGLVSADLARRLRECKRDIDDFELKYRMTFAEFAEAWEGDEIPNKWSHQVERDYMIWEGLEAEKRKWLAESKGGRKMDRIYQINREEFGSKGDRIYEKIKPLLEPEHEGGIVAIEVESGDYFLGETVIKAGQKAKEKYPDKVFYFVRIGYPAVHVFR